MYLYDTDLLTVTNINRVSYMQTRQNNKSNDYSAKLLFMPSIYNETMDLLCEAQEYFTEFGDDDQRDMEDEIRSLYTREMSRITLRLSCIMSWLLARRSIVSGEIENINPAHYRLEFQNVCYVDNKVLHGILPSYVCYLLDSTLELYDRVLRLDKQFFEKTIN